MNQDQQDYGNNGGVPDQELGMGYSNITQMGTTTFCVNTSDIKLDGKPISVIEFGSSMNFATVQKDLGVDVTLDVDISKFSGSLAAQYAKSIQDVGYSISFSFVFQIQLPTRVLHIDQFGPAALNPFGAGAFAEGQDRFREICGDSFSVEEKSGARLYTTLNVKFDSKYDKTKFAANFNGNLADLGSAVLEIDGVAEKHSISGSIELSAIQEGGDVMQLTGIFGKTDQNNILNCRLNATAMDGCNKAISDIINYAKQEFAYQIRLDNATGNIIGVPSALGYTYLEYDKIGIDEQHFGLTPEVLAIRRFLGQTDDFLRTTDAYLKTVIYSGHVSGLMDYSVYKDPQIWGGKWFWNPEWIDIEQTAQLQRTSASVTNIMGVLESSYVGAIQCYKDPSLCKSVNDTVTRAMADNPIATSTLNLFHKAISFTTNCDGVNYGYRFMLPVGLMAQGQGTKYMEQSNFTLIPEAKSVVITRTYWVKITNDPDLAALKIIDSSNDPTVIHNCLTFSPTGNDDAISVYTGPLIGPCKDAMCPTVSGATAYITFFEVESPL